MVMQPVRHHEGSKHIWYWQRAATDHLNGSKFMALRSCSAQHFAAVVHLAAHVTGLLKHYEA